MVNRRIQYIQDIMNNSYIEKKNEGYTKYYNKDIEILQQKNFYVVLDKRDSKNIKLFTNLDIAHRHIIKD